MADEDHLIKRFHVPANNMLLNIFRMKTLTECLLWKCISNLLFMSVKVFMDTGYWHIKKLIINDSYFYIFNSTQKQGVASVWCKLMRLGLKNHIAYDSDSKQSKFYHRFWSDSDFNDEIVSTIAISIYFQLNSSNFDWIPPIFI